MIHEVINLAFISMPGGAEWIVIAIIGLLIFGKRLPEVGKSLGKSIVEFKKGLKGMEEDLDRSVERDQKDMLPPPDPRATATTDTRDPASVTPVAHTNSTDPAP